MISIPLTILALLDGHQQNKSLEVCYRLQNSLVAFWDHPCGDARLHEDLLAFSVLNEHQALISTGWRHCQIKKGQWQTHLFLMRKYQSHY